MPAPSTGMDWTDQTISTLRILWSEGHSTAEIGRRMDTTKNAIVGKAHRLQLPARPSPIRVASPDRAERTPGVKPSPSALVSLLPAAPDAPRPLTAPSQVVEAAPTALPPPVPTPTPEPPPVRPVSPVTARRASTCQWPIGEPGKAGFHLCGDEPAPSKPYCPSHCGRAYVRPRIAADAFAAS